MIAEGTALVERALSSRAFRLVCAPGGDLGGARRGGRRPAPPTGRRSSACTSAAGDRAIAGGRAEPRRGRGHARRPGGGPGAESTRSWREATGGLSPRARGAGRSVPPPGRSGEARAAYERALALTHQEAGSGLFEATGRTRQRQTLNRRRRRGAEKIIVPADVDSCTARSTSCRRRPY